jgi:hypothetical protein
MNVEALADAMAEEFVMVNVEADAARVRQADEWANVPPHRSSL